MAETTTFSGCKLTVPSDPSGYTAACFGAAGCNTLAKYWTSLMKLLSPLVTCTQRSDKTGSRLKHWSYLLNCINKSPENMSIYLLCHRVDFLNSKTGSSFSVKQIKHDLSWHRQSGSQKLSSLWQMEFPYSQHQPLCEIFKKYKMSHSHLSLISDV